MDTEKALARVEELLKPFSKEITNRLPTGSTRSWLLKIWLSGNCSDKRKLGLPPHHYRSGCTRARPGGQ
jgi:hypothetical protein